MQDEAPPAGAWASRGGKDGHSGGKGGKSVGGKGGERKGGGKYGGYGDFGGGGGGRFAGGGGKSWTKKGWSMSGRSALGVSSGRCGALVVGPELVSFEALPPRQALRVRNWSSSYHTASTIAKFLWGGRRPTNNARGVLSPNRCRKGQQMALEGGGGGRSAHSDRQDRCCHHCCFPPVAPILGRFGQHRPILFSGYGCGVGVDSRDRELIAGELGQIGSRFGNELQRQTSEAETQFGPSRSLAL